MKRFLAVALVSIPLLFCGASLAFAQTDITPPEPQTVQATDITPSISSVSISTPVIDSNGNVTNGPTQNFSVTGNSTSNAAAPAPKPSGKAPSFFDNPIGYLMFQIVSLFAWLVGVAGIALNVSAYYSIVRMGYLVGQLSALQVAWSTFRDIGNLLLLFGFIFFGISTILDNAGYNQKKVLIMLILVAVAINFSSLFARLIIDTGNILAIQFYKAFNGGALPTDIPTSNGIANVFMNSLKLTTIYDNPDLITAKTMFIGFLAIILFIVVTFVFFSIAFLLISRFVVLVFLITVSPLAFAALVIPKYEEQFKRWMSMLVNYTLVAPVMLLLLLVSTRIVTSPTFTNLIPGGDGVTWGQFAQSPAGVGGATSGANILIVFMIACGFYIASLIAAKQMGAVGANAVINIGQGARRSFQGVIGRTAITPIRVGVGKTVRNTQLAVNRAVGANVFTGKAGQSMIDNAKKATYGSKYSVESRAKDIKEVKSVVEQERRKKELKDELKKAQVARAEAGTDQNRIDDANHEIATTLGKMSNKEIEELEGIKKADETLVQNLSPQQFKSLMESKEVGEDVKNKLRTARFKGVNTLIETAKNNPGDAAAQKKAKDAIATIASKDLQLADPSFLENEFVADNLTNKQYEDLTKSDALSPSTERKLTDVRKGRWDVTKRTDDELAASIIALKGDTDQLARVPVDVYKRQGVLDKLSLTDFDGMRKKVNPEARRAVGQHLVRRAATDQLIKDYLDNDPTTKRDFLIPQAQPAPAQPAQPAQPQNPPRQPYRPNMYASNNQPRP